MPVSLMVIPCTILDSDIEVFGQHSVESTTTGRRRRGQQRQKISCGMNVYLISIIAHLVAKIAGGHSGSRT